MMVMDNIQNKDKKRVNVIVSIAGKSLMRPLI